MKHRRNYTYDTAPAVIRTTPGPDGHVHAAIISDCGNGWTDTVAGHRHRVAELEFGPAVSPWGGGSLVEQHTHDIAGRATRPTAQAPGVLCPA